MLGDEMEIGRVYAYRRKARRGEPLLKVTLLDKVGRGGRIRVRFEDGPHPGLDEYVRTRNVVCPWGERRVVLRDEEREAGLEEWVESRGGGSDHALIEAASAVLASSGEPGAAASSITTMDQDELQRIIDRAGLTVEPVELHPMAFCDRFDRVHMPLEGAVALAQAFAAAEPRTVLRYLDDQEEEMRLRGNEPGDRFWHQYLRELAPGYALARRWAGTEQEAAQLREEIARLRLLVNRAAQELLSAGQERAARRLQRALEGG